MARHRPTARHFHNQPELQTGAGTGLMLRWILYVWLAGCVPLGNTVKQDGKHSVNFRPCSPGLIDLG
ncbi:unnamed protein product, partial [Iphiclides podalirius]